MKIIKYGHIQDPGVSQSQSETGAHGLNVKEPERNYHAMLQCGRWTISTNWLDDIKSNASERPSPAVWAAIYLRSGRTQQ